MLFKFFRQITCDPICTYSYWFAHILKGVFRNQIILAFAQQQPNRRIIMFLFQNSVHRRKIEIQLTRVFRFKLPSLQFDNHIAAQIQIIEKISEYIEIYTTEDTAVAG